MSDDDARADSHRIVWFAYRSSVMHMSHSSPTRRVFSQYSISPPTRVVDTVYHDLEYIHHLPAPISMSRDLDWRRGTPPPLPPPPTHLDLCPSEVSSGGGWPPRHVFSTSPVSSPLLAPPKPRRSRSPGERSSSSSSRSRSRERHVIWDVSSRRSSSGRSSSHRPAAVSGYPRVYHPDAGGGPHSSCKPAPPRLRRMHDLCDEEAVVYHSTDRDAAGMDAEAIVQTRASSRRSQEENAPIAKRLRR